MAEICRLGPLRPMISVGGMSKDDEESLRRAEQGARTERVGVEFCPVCGETGRTISQRCKRVALFYGYKPKELFALAAARRSIAVPFFEINRFFFLLETLGCHAMKYAMLEAVEFAEDLRYTGERSIEYGNGVWVLAFSNTDFPDCTELYLKEDVSKTMVIYREDGAIEHLGSEERAVLFAELAKRFFGLGAVVPPSVCGLTPAGKKFVVTAGLSRDVYLSLENSPRRDLPALWRAGLLPRLALLDFVLGQNDRSGLNILLSTERSPRVGLIDNDDSFVTHERLVACFAYLEGLADDSNLGLAREWFAPLRLARLVGQLAPLAIPESIMIPLCRRFSFARLAVSTNMALREFKQAAFIERPPLTWHLANCPWTVYLPLVKESADAIAYRIIVGEWTGTRCVIDLVEGRFLDRHVTCTRTAVAASSSDADEKIAQLTLAAQRDGYLHVVRRRFFVREHGEAGTEELLIVEVRDDQASFHMIVRRGTLGYYDDRQVERYDSFSSMSAAVACADALEAELLAANYADLRSRLSSFKAATPLNLF